MRARTDEHFLRQLLAPQTHFDIVQCGLSTAHANWIVQKRTIPEHLIYLITSNFCDARVAGRNYRLEPGSFIWVSPGVLHEFKIPKGHAPFEFYHFKVGIHGKRQSDAVRGARECVFIPRAQELQSLCAQLVRETYGKGAYGDLPFRSALLLLCARALTLSQSRADERLTFTVAQQRMLNDYAEKRIRERPGTAELAKLVRLSTDYFSRLFRKTYGLSPRAWLVRERMKHAAEELAHSARSISEIAYAFGFSDIFLFSRQFKQIHGRSPRDYRREPSA